MFNINNKNIKSIILSHHGKILFENYYNGSHKSKKEPINSITKSIVSILLGISLKDKKIKSLYTKLEYFFKGKNDSTIKEHIQMSSGMDWGENLLEEPYTVDMINSKSWINYILNKKYINARDFKYNGGSSHLIAKIISMTNDLKLEEYSKIKLFDTLEIDTTGDIEKIEYPLRKTLWTRKKHWDEDSENNNIGAFGLSLTALDLFKIGNFILEEYENNKYIDSKYLTNMTEDLVKVSNIGYYGYHWWIRKIKGVKVISALGIGNQYLTIVPEFKLVLVLLSKNSSQNNLEIEKIYRNILSYGFKVTC